MAVLYFSFDTNVEKRDPDIAGPQLDSLIFRTKEGQYLSIGCGFESGFTLENHFLTGDWKGLEYSLEDADGNTIQDWENEWESDEKNNRLIELLEDSDLVAFHIDDDDLADHGYDGDFVPECKNIRVDIYVNDSEFKFKKDELITEEKLIYAKDIDHEVPDR